MEHSVFLQETGLGSLLISLVSPDCCDILARMSVFSRQILVAKETLTVKTCFLSYFIQLFIQTTSLHHQSLEIDMSHVHELLKSVQLPRLDSRTG